MGIQSRRELLAALRPRYRRASKAEKGQILDGFVAATGYHRKYAISLLGHGPRPVSRRPRRRRPTYGPAVVRVLTQLWELSGQLCAKRLQPFLPTLLEALERAGELTLTPPHLKAAVLRISPATLARKLRPARRRRHGRGRSTTRAGHLLKHQVPIRTFADWNEARPGFTEIDLVAHCGESLRGEYLNTLSVVDVATGWLECGAVTYRSQREVFAALEAIRQRLPFGLLGIDSDNDSAFLNDHLVRYCQQQQLTFTRSRPYRKNDQAHVEQKNGSVVRGLVGYDRYEGAAATRALNAVYTVLRLWVNFFQPSMKLIAKQRVGSRVRKQYDRAQTPYQRLLASPQVSQADKDALRQQFLSLNPVAVRRALDERLAVFWQRAVR
jgi:hypothetical protein